MTLPFDTRKVVSSKAFVDATEAERANTSGRGRIVDDYFEFSDEPGWLCKLGNLALVEYDDGSQELRKLEEATFVTELALTTLGYRREGLEATFGEPADRNFKDCGAVWSFAHIDEVERTVVAPAARIIVQAFGGFPELDGVVNRPEEPISWIAPIPEAQ